MAYFANGSGGDYLTAQCDDCKLPNDAPCPILLMQLTYNYDQFTNGEPNKVADVMNTLIGEDCKCKMKPLLDELE